MLFDLRGRGRRRTVQAVYLGLAILMGGGLVLFGVGTGGSNGGLLNAFGGGSGSAQKQVVSQDEQKALKQTQLRPNDPAGWAALVQARWTSAGQGADFNPSTGTFTASGRKELIAATQAWQRYLQLVQNPSTDIAVLAARAYGALSDYAHEAAAWEIEARASPGQPKGFECLAAAAYAAKETHKGDVATATALSLVPQAQRATLQQALQQAKTQPQVAQQC